MVQPQGSRLLAFAKAPSRNQCRDQRGQGHMQGDEAQYDSSLFISEPILFIYVFVSVIMQS